MEPPFDTPTPSAKPHAMPLEHRRDPETSRKWTMHHSRWTKTPDAGAYTVCVSDRFLATRDVARVSGLTPNAIRAAVKRGELRPSFRTQAGAALYTFADVDAWMARRKAARP
jgi:predicted DNA-binding transcriptional regulator AlpA